MITIIQIITIATTMIIVILTTDIEGDKKI